MKKELIRYSSSQTLFNYYRDNNNLLDKKGGNTIRLKNLYNYLASYTTYPDYLLIGEAPGIKGCRFSGVPFTSERQLVEKILPFYGQQSSKFSPPYTENTASIFWNTLKEHFPSFFIWNSVPFHPHPSGNYEKNRKPTKDEIELFAELTENIIGILQPKKIIAIGKTAKYLEKCIKNLKMTQVRHPSYGGKQEFVIQINKLFGKKIVKLTRKTLF